MTCRQVYASSSQLVGTNTRIVVAWKGPRAALPRGDQQHQALWEAVQPGPLVPATEITATVTCMDGGAEELTMAGLQAELRARGRRAGDDILMGRLSLGSKVPLVSHEQTERNGQGSGRHSGCRKQPRPERMPLSGQDTEQPAVTLSTPGSSQAGSDAEEVSFGKSACPGRLETNSEIGTEVVTSKGRQGTAVSKACGYYELQLTEGKSAIHCSIQDLEMASVKHERIDVAAAATAAADPKADTAAADTSPRSREQRAQQRSGRGGQPKLLLSDLDGPALPPLCPPTPRAFGCALNASDPRSVAQAP